MGGARWSRGLIPAPRPGGPRFESRRRRQILFSTFRGRNRGRKDRERRNDDVIKKRSSLEHSQNGWMDARAREAGTRARAQSTGRID